MPLAQTDGQPGEHCHLDFKAILVRSVHEYVLRFVDPASVFIIDVLMSDTKRHLETEGTMTAKRQRLDESYVVNRAMEQCAFLDERARLGRLCDYRREDGTQLGTCVSLNANGS